jgi:hypothetical protein
MHRMRTIRLTMFLWLIALSGCVSVGTEAIIMKSAADPVGFLQEQHKVKDLGFTQGQAC